LKIYAKMNFREVRIKKGFTIVSLSEAIGVTKQTIGQVERRVNGIGPKKATEIANILGVSFDEIFELVERGE
jgi:transcriptional regulator with XRE-family HTH domain